MEIPGSNSGKFFSTFFCTPFYPMVTTLLEYLDPVILHLFGFCFMTNSIAIQTIKGTATMISLSTHQFSSYSYTRFTL